jgi:hypothetical protein
MGVDYYTCKDCNECYSDCGDSWVYCSSCHENLEDEKLCIDCFEEEKYDKYKLYYRNNKSLDFHFKLCSYCIKSNIDELYDDVIYTLSTKSMDGSFIRKHLTKNRFIDLIDNHIMKFFNINVEIQELKNELDINEKEINLLEKTQDKLRSKLKKLESEIVK